VTARRLKYNVDGSMLERFKEVNQSFPKTAQIMAAKERGQ
jgi:hypothetical protein